MYLLLRVGDEDKLAEARAILASYGFNQVITGESMREVCVDCAGNEDEEEETPLVSKEIVEMIDPKAHQPEENSNQMAQFIKEEIIEPEESYAMANSFKEEGPISIFKEEEPDHEEVPAHMQFCRNDDEGEDGHLFITRVQMPGPSTSDFQEEQMSLFASNSSRKRKKAAPAETEEISEFSRSNQLKSGFEKVGMVGNHLMRLQRINKDGSSLYYCFYRNRVYSACPGAIRFCGKLNSANCGAQLLIKHNHEPTEEQNKIEVIKFKQRVMAKENPNLDVKKIIRDCISKTEGSSPDLALLGSYNSQKRRIQRQQRAKKAKTRTAIETEEQFWTRRLEQSKLAQTSSVEYGRRPIRNIHQFN